jgi:RNA polymerase sigma factor (TIGR02999 family)
MADPNEDTTRDLLRRWAGGDRRAFERLLPPVYAELRRIARGLLRDHRGHETLQTTALAHEALLRLLGRPVAEFESTAHLLNASARIMRRILVDRARAAAADKRGGGWIRDEFGDALELPIPQGTDLDALDQALTEMEALEPRLAQGVELRYFVGLEVREIAATLGVTVRTAHRDWIAARVWLRERLGA